MKGHAKRAIVLALGILVSAVTFYYFLHRLRGQWDEVVQTFRAANYLYLVPGVGFLAVLYWFRVVRWRLFLVPVKRVRRLSVASATCIGFMANCVLPARVGELIRPYVLSRKEEGVSFGHALATAAGLERMFDLIGLSILMLITWVLLAPYMAERVPDAGAEGAFAWAADGGGVVVAMGEPAQEPEGEDLIQKTWRKGIVFVFLAAVCAVMLVAVALFPRPFRRLAGVFIRFLPAAWRGPLGEFIQSVTDALSFLKSWKGVALAVAYSIGLWLAQGLSTYAIALGLNLELGVGGSFLVVIAVAVAVALPQGPAFIGPFQLAAMVAAGSFAASQGEAGAFALLMWLVNVVPITLVGLGFLWFEGLSLGQLTSASREMEEKAREEHEAQGE